MNDLRAWESDRNQIEGANNDQIGWKKEFGDAQ